MPKITPEMIEAARSAYNANTPTIIPRGGKLAHETKLMHTILAAALSARPVVKPLLWKASPLSDSLVAAHPFGENYVIQNCGHYFRTVGQDFPTMEEAKAAAQADYDARILSALVSDARVERLEKAMKEIAATNPVKPSDNPLAWRLINTARAALANEERDDG